MIAEWQLGSKRNDRIANLPESLNNVSQTYPIVSKSC